jgi:type I protein arginine methyltransferase
MDVGAGSGLLSIFAVQAGAKKVYAVEASNMAEHAKTLIKANNLQDKIEVICGKIEDIPESQLGPESIDVIVSEPLGTYLLNERMLETYVIARDRFLKKDTGIMFPQSAQLCIIPFEDKEIYEEQVGKVNFWTTKDFHGFDLSCMYETAVDEKLSQPILDTYDAAKK